ncbi:MAG: hypothetical protein ACM3QX_13860 [Syntrophomonadaceae bacterium]
MNIELIIIAAFVIVTFLLLQIVKIRRPHQPGAADEQKSGETIVSPDEDELMEVSVLDENATLK